MGHTQVSFRSTQSPQDFFSCGPDDENPCRKSSKTSKLGEHHAALVPDNRPLKPSLFLSVREFGVKQFGRKWISERGIAEDVAYLLHAQAGFPRLDYGLESSIRFGGKLADLFPTSCL